MKLLLDENVSDRIVPHIIDFFPDSVHVKSVGLERTDDTVIWNWAKPHGFTIVAKDTDFYQRASPSVIRRNSSGCELGTAPRA
jgi:predicted nuclease of predicted toxin-antitoxin system